MRIFKQWVLAIVLYLAMVVEGILSVYLHQFMFIGKSLQASLMILPVAVTVIGFEDERNTKEFWLALAFGVIADLYFYGIIGIYAVGLPFLSAFGRWFSRIFPELFIIRLIGVCIGTSIFSIYTWAILKILTWTAAGWKDALNSVLFTLIWTIITTILTYWLWALMARKYPFLSNSDNYTYTF